MKPLRIGVVGAGALGYHHVRLLRQMPEFRLSGFVEARPERAAQVASELEVPSYSDLDTLLGAFLAHTRSEAAMTLALRRLVGLEPRLEPAF